MGGVDIAAVKKNDFHTRGCHKLELTNYKQEGLSRFLKLPAEDAFR